MEITRKYWEGNIRTRFNEPPNLVLDTELIEFGAKALDKIEQLQAELVKQKKAFEKIITESGKVDINNWPAQQQICQNIAKEALEPILPKERKE